MTQQKAVKELVIGRMVLLSYQDHVNKYGIVVNKSNVESWDKASYRILVLVNQNHPEIPVCQTLRYFCLYDLGYT